MFCSLSNARLPPNHSVRALVRKWRTLAKSSSAESSAPKHRVSTFPSTLEEVNSLGRNSMILDSIGLSVMARILVISSALSTSAWFVKSARSPVRNSFNSAEDLLEHNTPKCELSVRLRAISRHAPDCWNQRETCSDYGGANAGGTRCDKRRDRAEGAKERGEPPVPRKVDEPKS